MQILDGAIHRRLMGGFGDPGDQGLERRLLLLLRRNCRRRRTRRQRQRQQRGPLWQRIIPSEAALGQKLSELAQLAVHTVGGGEPQPAPQVLDQWEERGI